MASLSRKLYIFLTCQRVATACSKFARINQPSVMAKAVQGLRYYCTTTITQPLCICGITPDSTATCKGEACNSTHCCYTQCVKQCFNPATQFYTKHTVGGTARACFLVLLSFGFLLSIVLLRLLLLLQLPHPVALRQRVDA